MKHTRFTRWKTQTCETWLYTLGCYAIKLLNHVKIQSMFNPLWPLWVIRFLIDLWIDPTPGTEFWPTGFVWWVNWLYQESQDGRGWFLVPTVISLSEWVWQGHPDFMEGSTPSNVPQPGTYTDREVWGLTGRSDAEDLMGAAHRSQVFSLVKSSFETNLERLFQDQASPQQSFIEAFNMALKVTERLRVLRTSLCFFLQVMAMS